MRSASRFRKILVALAVVALVLAAWVGVSILTLPSVAPLAKPGVSMAINVKDWHRRDHPFVVGPRNPRWTPYGATPAALKKAVVASEDANFYSHEGVDYEAIREAIKADWRKGRFVHGGSTITQQLAKNLFLTREKTLIRKVKELVLARRMDDALPKSRILELYLNVVELGPMVYGIGHAAHYYFGKPASVLTVRECSFLASMLPGPKVYNPYRKMDRVMKRSDRILRRMVAAQMISRGAVRQKGPGGREREGSPPAVSRLVEEASAAAAAVFSRSTLADLVREEDEAAERRRRNVMYVI